ncbi:Chondroitinase-B precursor [Planctomycetes bacterium MalM25]|nr:Chondroitinase-B precursor [Planctomycetes bacterium MalM25]
MKNTPSTAAAILTLVVGCASADAAEFLVGSAAQISTALQTAQPGDTLVMADGVWTNQRIEFASDGLAGSPITLRAQTPGGVVLNGNSSLRISGDHLVADGLRFEGGALGDNDHIVQFRGSNGEATNSRLTNSTFIDYNPASINTRYFWVSMYGQSNRVDHNHFSGQSHSGVTVTVWRSDPVADLHQIDNNYFGDRPEGNGNGFETIRIGTSDQSLSNSLTVVENNLFERTDGEIEIISNKSGSNTFRYNTFRDSSGTLTLRHGNDTLVEGNFFLGEGKSGSGGVRVIGERQTLINNYFQNLDGRADGAISISAGVENSPLNEYFQVKDALIAHNTIVSVNDAAITFDHGLGSSDRTLLAEDVTVANNLIWSTQDPLFEGNEGSGWTWEGNIAFGQSLGPAAGNPGVTFVDPQLTLGADGLFRPGSNSPSVNNGVGDYSGLISTDMDGQPRVSVFDIGADEFSAAAIVRKPLEAGDVGPDWLTVTPPPPTPSGGGCDEFGCAIQAEDFASMLDPDGNGLVWTIDTVADALGGEVLVAPNGDRVELPGEQHDSIATYDLEFESIGTYTAYYRARGFSSSTDSLFTPADFGIDPNVTENLSSNGDFRWEKSGVTFAVGGTEVGVPLELRLGMREQDAEFDALVLSLDNNLTDEELDALFDVLLGDYNGDGLVDAADYTVWRDQNGQSGPGLAADGDGDGDVDADDRLIWLNAYGSSDATSASAAVPEPSTLVALPALILASLGRSRRHG